MCAASDGGAPTVHVQDGAVGERCVVTGEVGDCGRDFLGDAGSAGGQAGHQFLDQCRVLEEKPGRGDSGMLLTVTATGIGRSRPGIERMVVVFPAP